MNGVRRRSSLFGTGLKVETVADLQVVVGLPIVFIAIGNDDSATADDFKLVAANDNGGWLFQADPQQFRVGRNHGGHVLFPFAGFYVLINSSIPEEAKALFISF